MAKTKKLFAMFFVAALFSGSVLITGCGGGPSPEQMQQLNDLRAEVESLQSQVNDAQNQKSQLARQVADKEAKVKGYLAEIGNVQKRCP
jgi:outer membrane murein-binding lipoprotein Lpp